MTGKFPLPPNFFRCPPLTADESNYMSGLARKSLLDLVRHSRIEGGPIKWTLDSDESGLQIYSGEDPTAPTEMRFLCSTTEVMATIEEAAALFRLETTELFREYLRMFAKDLLDAASLYTLAMPTEEHPRHYIGVKWTCLESPSSLIKNRDWCYLECQDDFEINGRRGWARSLSSIKLPCCPDLQNSLGIVRASFYRTGYVFLETDRPGYLQVIHAIQVDFKGNVPSWVVKIGMKKRARSIGEIDQYLREKRLSGEKFLVDHELVPKVARSKCFLCHKKYGAFTKKHNCRRCGEVVCSSCSKFWNVEMNGHRAHLRVCSACSIGAFNKGLPSVQAFPDNASMTSIDASTKAAPFDRKSALAPTTPRQGQVKREVLEKQRTKARDDIGVQAHSKDTPSNNGKSHQARQVPMAVPVQSAAVIDARPPQQRQGAGYPRYDDDRRGQYFDDPDDDIQEDSIHHYAPLNAKNLEMFTQRQGPAKPVPFTAQPNKQFDLPPPPQPPHHQYPSHASHDRYYDETDEDRYHRRNHHPYDNRHQPPHHQYSGSDQYYHDGGYTHAAARPGADAEYHPDHRPYDRRYVAPYTDDGYAAYPDPRYNAYPDDRYGGYGQYDGAPGHQGYYEDDLRGAADAYAMHPRYHDPSPAYADRYDDGYRPGGGSVDDERTIASSSRNGYPSESRYPGVGEGNYAPRPLDDSSYRQHDYHFDQDRRRVDEGLHPVRGGYDDDRTSRAPVDATATNSSSNSKEADLAALFKQMEVLGLKPADGESSQQQLLALYKQLQQLNLESTAAATAPQAA